MAVASGLSLVAGLLCADPRADWTPPAQGRIVLSREATWEAPGAVHALAFEHLAAGLWLTSGLLAQQALREGADLRALDRARFDVILAAVRFMAARYAPGIVLDAHFAEVAPHVAVLLERLADDPRGRGAHQRWRRWVAGPGDER